MASDSATTFYTSDGKPGQIYEHANKMVNLVKGLPIGVMTSGSGGIGNASIATLLKDLRQRLAGDDETNTDWRLDPINKCFQGSCWHPPIITPPAFPRRSEKTIGALTTSASCIEFDARPP